MIGACYRYVVLGVLVIGLAAITICGIDALSPLPDKDNDWPHLMYRIAAAATIGSVVSHVYDNKGMLKLPDIGPAEVNLGVIGDVLMGILAAFGAIYLLHATLKADMNLSPGVALLAGLASARLIPSFRDSITNRIASLEKDVEKGEKKLTARDYHQWGDLKAGQGKYIEAIDFYRYALEADPKYTPVLSALADAYVHMANKATSQTTKDEYHAKALDYNRRVEADAGTDAQKLGGALLQKADILLAMGKTADAADALQKGIDQFKAAKQDDDRILAYVLANEKIDAAVKTANAQIKPIVDSLGAKP